MITTKRFYRPDEVAVILGVSTRSVQRWAASGVLPSARIGNLLRIPRDQLEALMARRATGTLDRFSDKRAKER